MSPTFPRPHLLALLACAALAACGTPTGTVQPDGVVEWDDHPPGTSPAGLALLKGVNEASTNEVIRIMTIDGRQVPGPSAAAVSLKPGQHAVKLQWMQGAGGQDWFTYTAQIDARPNCLYSFRSSHVAGSQMVRFDVTRAPLSAAGNRDCGKGMVSEARPVG